MKSNLVDYNIYNMSVIEKIKYIIFGFCVMFLLGYLFYNKIILAIIMGFVGTLYPRFKKKDLIEKRKKELKIQFKEGIYALSSSLSAGKSIEQCFEIVLKDLRILYSDNAQIIREFEIIVRKIKMNETIEEAISDLAKRANIDDITNFANVFITTKRTGGDLVKIIRYTTEIINEKTEVQNEIDVLITQKKYEYKILILLVPIIIIYLQIISPEYLEVVYSSVIGNLTMTIGLILYGFSYFLGSKITDIEV